MKIIDTKGAILTGDNHPQLKIGDKLYLVDDRKSTWDAIQKAQSDPACADPDMAALELALGKDAVDEIIKAENGITFEGFQNLTFYVMGAITGQDAEELKAQATGRKN